VTSAIGSKLLKRKTQTTSQKLKRKNYPEQSMKSMNTAAKLVIRALLATCSKNILMLFWNMVAQEQALAQVILTKYGECQEKERTEEIYTSLWKLRAEAVR
jgi:hypothetical protein